MNIKEMPKVLLHIHLDGSVRIETLNELLNQDMHSLVTTNKNVHSLKDYLTKFELPLSVMQTSANITRITSELLDDLEKENIIYAEIRFAPFFHTKEGLSLEEVVESVLKGTYNKKIKVKLILCMMRGDKEENNNQVIDLALKYLNKGVGGIDLAGNEAKYPNTLYQTLFKRLYSLNIPFTIHAGEGDSYKSIDSALSFKTKRIGHGVNCIQSEETMKRLLLNKVTLEVCPTSNIDTCIVDDYSLHPVKKLYDLGLSITINTDNNTVSNINLTKEYEKLVKYFNFKKEDFKKMNLNAIEASFLNDKEKKHLKELL